VSVVRSFERGSVIAGKYRVERVIGQGGMGVVLAARHLGLDEMVAVKLVRSEGAEAPLAFARLQREARAAARIKSEHVARVLDVDRLPDGAPYIVMELIDGTDLHVLLARRGELPIDEATSYVMQACEGLAEAHALGMVHRDLKLKNLFLTKRRDGRALIKVIDFGVVKLSPYVVEDDAERRQGSDVALARMPSREATLTGIATLVGSLHYMAPEQIRASNVVNAQADVWSLGVCLYAMLTGSLPFDGETVAEVSAAIQGRPAPDVRDVAPGVPTGLATAIARMLEKDVRRRFANVFELASAIAPYSLDVAAPTRIETILQSSVETGSATNVGLEQPSEPSGDVSSSQVTGRVESTVTNVPIGRDDSTMGAAAVDSRALSTVASASRSKRWAAAGATLLVAGAIAMSRLRPAADPSRDASGNDTNTTAAPALTPSASGSAAPPLASSLPPTSTDSAVSASAAATRSPLASAASSGATVPAPSSPKKTTMRPAPSAAPAPTAAESSAYDRF
jgi:serine/threonine-protein kinase